MRSFTLGIALFLAAAAAAFAGGGAEAASDAPAPPDSPQIVATTTIVGDVVRAVAGEQASVVVLMEPGDNPHSYEPAPSDLRAVERAAVVFVNGFGLEEDLLDDLDRMATGRVVSVSEGIEPLEGHDHEDDDHEHEASHDDHDDDDHEHEASHDEHEGDDHHHEFDPHVWTDPNNVMIWVANIVAALSDVDPARAAEYRANGDRYLGELEELDSFMRDAFDAIPSERRRLVLDHETFSYLADEYGFETIATIVPGTSDRSDPSAQEVARLVDLIRAEDVGAIFVGRTASRGLEQLARTIAGEAGTSVRIIPTLTGSLAASGERGDTYLDFMRYNTEQIVAGLAAE